MGWGHSAADLVHAYAASGLTDGSRPCSSRGTARV